MPVEGSNPSPFRDLPDISNISIVRTDLGGKCIVSVLIQILYIMHSVFLSLQATVFIF